MADIKAGDILPSLYSSFESSNINRASLFVSLFLCFDTASLHSAYEPRYGFSKFRYGR